ncbi:MAG: cytochrome c oxidase subunit II [Legionellales bacterium]|nr:cytochrome c oxidase subunit II [Legionellales bacterium]
MSLMTRCVASALAFFSPAVWAAHQLNMTPGVTPTSERVYHLHMTIFYICVAIGVVVFGIMFYAILRHRKSLGYKPATFHESTTVEIIWTVIPFLILIAMAVPATRTLIAMEDSSNADLTVRITGYQWKWHYAYHDHDISFFSNLSTPIEQIQNEAPKGENYLLEVDNPLVLPIGKKVRFLGTSNDVIHSWWVPALAVKKDTIPGFINESWAFIKEPGTYRGQCAELCGINHGYMPIVVEAVSEPEFLDWVAEKKAEKIRAKQAALEAWSMEALMEKGEEIYNRACVACHQKDGTGMAGIFPALKGSPIALNDMEMHIRILLRGVPGTAMQSFANQLDDAEIAAVITYERNAWGNDTGELVQPSEIRAAR